MQQEVIMQQWLVPEGDTEACDTIFSPSPYSMEGINIDGNRVDRTGSKVHANQEWVWRFTVLMQEDIMVNEKVAIVGNCDSLGNWQLDGCVIMSKKGNDRNEMNIQGDPTIMDEGM